MNSNTNKIFIWFMAGALVFLCAGLFGFTVDAYGNRVDDTQPQQNHQKVTAPNSNAPQPKMICPMEWTSPVPSSNAGDMPPAGAVSFDWTDHPAASSYDLTVITPNGSLVDYDVDGSSKNLFLENYKQTGSYQVLVMALDANSAPLCSIAMSFNMPVVSSGGHVKKEGNGGESEPSSVSPSNPVVVPTPTEVEIN
ncbi:MAG: hypothetical protein OHK003_24590 [Anaerolineales bacterium]